MILCYREKRMQDGEASRALSVVDYVQCARSCRFLSLIKEDVFRDPKGVSSV